MVRNTKISWF